MNKHTHFKNLNFKPDSIKHILFFLCFLMKNQNILAQNSAWRGYVSYFNNQNVLTDEADQPLCNFVKNGELRIEPSATTQNLYWTNFAYQAPICLNDNFSYEIRFKNNTANNGFASYDVSFGLLSPSGGTGATLMGEMSGLPWTSLVVENQTLAAQEPYLVIDMSNWCVLKLTFKNNVLTYYYNDTPFFTAPYTGRMCSLLSFGFRCKGSAAVDWVRMTNNDDNSIIYFEDFINCNNMSAPLSCTPTINISANTPCEGDTLKLSTVNRATAYEWTGPNGFRSTSQNTAIPKTNRSASGTYSLKAQINACQTVTQSVNINVNALPKVNLGNDTSICSGKSLTLFAAGGAQYKWQNGSTNQSFNAINTGNYSVTVTDTEGCKASDTIKVTFPAASILPVVSVKKPSCYGRCDGEVTANPRGGFGAPYTFRWSGGRTTQTVIARCAGDINLTVTDSKGCTTSTIASVSQPPKIDAIVNPDTIYNGYAVRCADSEDGQATVKPSGGVGGYSVVWQTNPLQVTRTALGLKSDTTYKVFVYDKNGCSDSSTVTLTAPPPIEADFSIQNVRCTNEKNGIIKLDSVKGGIAPYFLTFNENKYTINATPEFSGLNSGEHIFEIRDTNGCTLQKSLTVQNPPKLKIISTNDTLIHFGDDVELQANLDTPSVLRSISWQPMHDSLTMQCKECRIALSSPRVTTIYKLTVKDTFGCIATKDITVRVDKIRKVFVPNIFSPNDDGLNDYLTIYTGNGTKRILKFNIFNRWGALIFAAHDFQPNDDKNGWDGYFKGKIADDELYVWFAEIEFEDGQREVFKGDVIIAR